MDTKELKEQFDSIADELKSKASSDNHSLILAMSTMFKMLLDIVNANGKQIGDLTSTINGLQETIKDLRRQLNQNSGNSSKPPSSDGYRKPSPKSLRTRSGKKPGGQKGHNGANMSLPHDPDEKVLHIPLKCQTCQHLSECTASNKIFACGESRYVVEAVITTRVIEHQSVKVKNCPYGEGKLTGDFPSDVKAYVQYGDSVSVLCGLLNTYGAVSYQRIHVLPGSMPGVSLSAATIHSMVSKCADKVGGTINKIAAFLKSEAVVHCDETGIRTRGKLYWVHNTSTSEYTFQTVNIKRGLDGITDNGVITNADFNGTAVHDCWGSYFGIEGVKHAVCCAHLLRELNGVVENDEKHSWAKRFIDFLLRMKKLKESSQAQGLGELDKDTLLEIDKEYDEIMSLADEESPPPEEPKVKKRGRKKKGKTRALIERLQKLKDMVCMFVKDFAVPFDNNQAERDLRNVKTKTKVSGCFRSEKGAQNYTKIMSYISTGNKHHITAYEALTAAFSGNADIVLN